jgi:hypothetical protein
MILTISRPADKFLLALKAHHWKRVVRKRRS